MKLPRNVSGEELAVMLEKYGYRITRQTGSHIRLTSNVMNREHHVTIPQHKPLKIGTLNSILIELAGYLELDKSILISRLFR